MELLNEFWTKVKSGLRIVVNYFFIILGMVGCFTIGYYYNALRDFNKIGKPKIYKAIDHTLAIDENNNGIIIENRRGTYIVLDAELVTKFFDIKARNMWGQHQTPKPVEK
jgi:hypothetical protein